MNSLGPSAEGDISPQGSIERDRGEVVAGTAQLTNSTQSKGPEVLKNMHVAHLWNRRRYEGALLFNLCAFILPALYATLSKFWVANIDSSLVVTTDIYTYIGVIVEVINEGLPRASWLIIGDKSSRPLATRIQLAYTLISIQMLLGTLLSIVFLTSSSLLAGFFVPAVVRATSLRYVRISSFSALASTTEYSVSLATRALDRPDVPLLISSVKFAINIVLDLIFISKIHVRGVIPNVNAQAAIRLSCDLAAAFSGLVYFVSCNKRLGGTMRGETQEHSTTPSLPALKVLAYPGTFTFIESAVRNALYLWLIHSMIELSADYATAWGVFNTIRWGLVMVPVLALESSSLAFVGHKWGAWRARVGLNTSPMTVAKKELFGIILPALVSVGIALLVEVPLCIFFSLWGAQSFAFYLSGSTSVAAIAGNMWRTIDWCYIFYAISTQLATILLATIPRWYLYQSLASNVLWVLPWAIVVSKANLTVENAWRYHSIVFGGSLVVSFIVVVLFDCVWAWKLLSGRLRLAPVASIDV
ncbi:hypothetical protein PIIN_06065 [Serendipita indica DSM 11827]|uniref:Uncharacterized protein n=1 Tax=Serendipita indica (strain DSM 11827) TaxID=1109443 RepID=G4TLD6_SERID|nr:hypothetical protein PIIN_06065 [Serendipita indica DSM 11827]